MKLQKKGVLILILLISYSSIVYAQELEIVAGPDLEVGQQFTVDGKTPAEQYFGTSTGITYEWDMNDDGNIDYRTPTISHTYNRVDAYRIILIAKSAGRTAQGITSIAVLPRGTFTGSSGSTSGSATQETADLCRNNLDDDNDGKTDCDDEECKISITTCMEDNPLIWMKFDSNLEYAKTATGTLQASQYGTQGKTVKYIEGKYGKGLQMDATSDAVRLPNDIRFGQISKYTIMAWVYLDSQDPRITREIIGENAWYHLNMVSLSDGTSKIIFTPRGRTFVAVSGDFYRKWTHVAITVDRESTTEEIALYINGEKKLTRGDNSYPPYSAPTPDYKLLVGAREANNILSDIFAGIIDELKIFPDLALTQEKIRQHMSVEPAEICTDTIDNDGDGAKDCGDSDCRLKKNNCVIPPDGDETNCSNEIDDAGGDTLIDCADSDCKDNPVCTGTSGTGEGPGGDGSSGGRSCSETSDCPTGDECVNGRCRTVSEGEGCSTNQDCSGNKICDIKTNVCEEPECTTSGECDSGETCDEGRCLNCNSDSDHDGTNDCDDPCPLIIGDDDSECDSNRDRYAVTCDDIGGVDCTGGECIGNSEGYESTRSILCCVPTSAASADEPICAPTSTYLSSLGRALQFAKGTCVDEDGDGEGTVTVTLLENGAPTTLLSQEQESLGITLDADGTYKEQCTTIPQNYEGPVTPLFTYGSLILTLLILAAFYFFKKSK